jgi:geranylgeranylglycerol-phosphate geranylgeranyltransferase
LKRSFLKNSLVAYAYPATIILGSIVSDAIVEPLILYFSVMGFIVGFAFEVLLDIIDVMGDKVFYVKSLPVLFGSKTAAKFSVVLFGAIIVLDPLPFFIRIDHRLYMDYLFFFLILPVVVLYFFISRELISDSSKKNCLKLKKLIILTMIMGSLAYLIGVQV